MFGNEERNETAETDRERESVWEKQLCALIKMEDCVEKRQGWWRKQSEV